MDRGGEREKKEGGQVSRQALVRFWRDREERQRYRET
jgi:hypothetical protein